MDRFDMNKRTMKMALEANLASAEASQPIKQEAAEILAIIVSSIKTGKKNLAQ